MKLIKRKKIILVAKAASGKTYLAEEFERNGFSANLSVTTRPKRDGEVHMKHYNFMPKWKFILNHLIGRFWETKKFNGWYYGTMNREWKNKDLFVFTPSGCRDIGFERLECFIVLIDIPTEIRYNRLKERGGADNAQRRVLADEKDFSGFHDYDMLIDNAFFDPEEMMCEILEEAIDE